MTLDYEILKHNVVLINLLTLQRHFPVPTERIVTGNQIGKETRLWRGMIPRKQNTSLSNSSVCASTITTGSVLSEPSTTKEMRMRYGNEVGLVSLALILPITATRMQSPNLGSKLPTVTLSNKPPWDLLQIPNSQLK